MTTAEAYPAKFATERRIPGSSAPHIASTPEVGMRQFFKEQADSDLERMRLGQLTPEEVNAVSREFAAIIGSPPGQIRNDLLEDGNIYDIAHRVFLARRSSPIPRTHSFSAVSL